MNILQVKENYHMIKEVFPNFLAGNTLFKQTEKQIGALKSLNPSNKKGESKQTDGIFPQNLMNDFIRAN